MIFKTEDLVSDIKNNSFAPVSTGTFTDPDDFITVLNKVLSLPMVSLINSVREDFFSKTIDVPLVANIAGYDIPERCVGDTFEDLYYVDSNGNQGAPLRRASKHTIDQYFQTGQYPIAFYVEDEQVVLLPKPTASSGSLRFYTKQRPNKLVSTTSCAKITSVTVNGSNIDFTVDTDLTSSLSAGSLIDFQKIKSPFRLSVQDATIASITSTTISVLATSVQDANSLTLPAKNDYICPAQSSNIPQIPQEGHPLLVQMSIMMLMQPLGHMDKWQMAETILKQQAKDFIDIIRNRIEAEPQKVVQRNTLLQALGGFYRLTTNR